MSAPMKRNLMSIIKFLSTLCFICFLTSVIETYSQDFHDYFICRKCGLEILKLADIVNIPSKLSLRQRNDTLGPKSGVLIQTFKNPHGMLYEVIGAHNANVYRTSEEISGDTWYPGFSWKILGCPRCMAHIGWEYIPMDKSDKKQTSFLGLVLSSLLYDNDADSLLVIPKSYRS